MCVCVCVSVSVYVRVGRGRGLALEGNNSDSLRFLQPKTKMCSNYNYVCSTCDPNIWRHH